MSLEFAIECFPKELTLRGGATCTMRPLEAEDESMFFEFFQSVPESERLFIKHRVTEPGVITQWCADIDYERNLPLLALAEGKVVGCATLHQQHAGWKRHIGRISVFVHDQHRERGIARGLVTELIEVARMMGLERLEAEFIGGQERAMNTFAFLGFSHLLRMEKYIKDMAAVPHDYVLMGLRLTTEEEYAGMG